MINTREQQRLAEAREQSVPWKRWGPYLSERQWEFTSTSALGLALPPLQFGG